MNEIKKAISDISDIRSQLAASTRFRGYAPEAVATIGVISLAVVIAQISWPERFAASNVQIAITWGAILLVSTIAVAVETIARSHRQHGGMAGAMLLSTMFTVLPVTTVCLVTGGVVLLRLPDAAWILPGIWQMLVGVVGFYSRSTLPRRIVWPAAWYMLCGVAATVLASLDGEITPLMAGGPFVVGHLWIARILLSEGVQTR